MKKATKGALAVTAAGALLLGGAGTLAYWNDTQAVSGSSISSGHLRLGAPTCGSWSLDGGATAFDAATEKIVPGDTLTRDCTLAVDMVGKSLHAQFDVTSAAMTGTLAGKVTTTAAYTITPSGGTAAAATPGATALIHNGDTIGAKITVAFPIGTAVDNTSRDVTGALSAITVTATQVP
jgi:alternate signal-mediated exported protein